MQYAVEHKQGRLVKINKIKFAKPAKIHHRVDLGHFQSRYNCLFKKVF
jgi:hypothetical protein